MEEYSASHRNSPPPLHEEVVDPFDPEFLRLVQDFRASVGVKRAPAIVPVRKPSKEWFIRCHPAYRLETTLLELKELRETYLVHPDMRPLLEEESTVVHRLLVTCMTRQGTIFLWPIALPRADGRDDSWSASAREAATRACECWVRIQPDQETQSYRIDYAEDLPDRPWPETTLRDLLARAFRGKVIDSLDHPVLRHLRGEA
jgi:hypothetical protein